MYFLDTIGIAIIGTYYGGGEGEYNEGKVMTKTFLSPQSKVAPNAHGTSDKKVWSEKVGLLLH